MISLIFKYCLYNYGLITHTHKIKYLLPSTHAGN